MNNIILNNYLRIALPLLCLLLTFGLSCTTLKNVETDNQMSNMKTLRIGINEQDYTGFMQKIKDLTITPIDARKSINESEDLVWISFQFIALDEFLVKRSAILSTGLVRQIH